MLTFIKDRCSSHPRRLLFPCPAPLGGKEASRSPGDGLLPVNTALVFVPWPLHSLPPRKGSWKGDGLRQDRPLTTPSVRRSEVGQGGPRWAYFRSKSRPSFIPPRAPVLTVAAKPPTPAHPPFCTQAAPHPPRSHSCLGLLSLPWAPVT